MTDEPLPLTFVYLKNAPFLVGLSTGKSPIDKNHKRVGNGDKSTLLAPRGKSPVAILEEAIFRFRSCPRTFDERGSKPSIAARDLRWFGFAACTVISWTDPCPGTQVRFRGELRHLWTDLSQNAGGSVLLDTGNRLQQFECLPKLRPVHAQEDFGVNLRQLLLQKCEVLKAELDRPAAPRLPGTGTPTDSIR
jgi:hypothetical protein